MARLSADIVLGMGIVLLTNAMAALVPGLCAHPSQHAQADDPADSSTLNPTLNPTIWVKRFMQAMAHYEAGNYAEAFPEFLLLADIGVAPAQTMVGISYRMGQGVAADPGQGALWLLRAANRGHAPAQLALVDIFLKGDGLAKDAQQAYKWLLVLEKYGDVDTRRRVRQRLPEISAELTHAQRQASRTQARSWQPILSKR
jgi:TPR repeat protein